MKKRTICIPMVEWMPAACRGWPQSVDHFICPTRQSYRAFSHLVSCDLFGWPVDVDEFKFQQRTTCERFVFINGTGGWSGRKGLACIRQALKLWPEMPLTIYTQRKIDGLPASVDVRREVASNVELYESGDVLISPHSCDGIGLELGESMSCGMPVISTDGAPWNELPALARIDATMKKVVVERPVPWYTPDARDLVTKCRDLHTTDISHASCAAREWALANSWQQHGTNLTRLVQSQQ